MNIHIFTSGKGGFGKTLCALNTTFYYLRGSSKNILCLDFNFENPDLSKILSFDTGFKSFESFQLSRVAAERCLIVRLPELFDIPKGEMEFWKYLGEVLGMLGSERKEFEHCIIDTGLHIGNLFSRDRERLNEDKKTIKKIFSGDKNKINNIYVWFIWTLSSLITDADNEQIKETAKILNDIKEVTFTEEKNLIHVFNPFGFYPSGIDLVQAILIIANLRYRHNSISSFLKLANAEIRSGINLFEITNLANNIIALSEGMNTPQVVLNEFGNQILDMYKGRPRNLLFLPSLDSQYVGLTETFNVSYKLSKFSEINAILGNYKKGKIRRYNATAYNVIGHFLDAFKEA